MYTPPLIRWTRPPHARGVRPALAPAIAATLLTCDDRTLPTSTPRAEASTTAARAAGQGVAIQGTLPLPVNQTGNTPVGVPLFGLTQAGTGPGGVFAITRNFSNQSALAATTSGAGNAASFRVTNPESNGAAVIAQSNSRGDAVGAIAFGRGRAGSFLVASAASGGSALLGQTFGTGSAGVFLVSNSANPSDALAATTSGTGWAGNFRGTSKGVQIRTNAGGTGLVVLGGTKNAIVATPSRARALYTEEATEVWFADYGFGRLANGRARILLDPVFLQTVSADRSYHVFVQPYGDADLYVAHRDGADFDVVLRGGDPAVEFSYRVVARRRGFEGRRLEPAPWADAALRPTAGGH